MTYKPGDRVEVAFPPEWKPGTVRAYRVTRGYYNTVSVDLDEPRSPRRREAMSVSDSHLLIRPLTTEDYCPACKTEGVTEGAMH